MVLGYFDAKRMLYGLEGRAFYLDAPESEIYYFNRLLAEAPELLADIFLPQIYRGVVSQAGKGITLKRGLGLQGIIFKFAGASGKAV